MWGHWYLVHYVVGTFLFSFLWAHKKHKNAQNVYKRTKIKNVHKKRLRGKKSLICLFMFLCFCLSVSVFFAHFLLFGRVKSFRKKIKINKEFKNALITSFTLLLSCNYLNVFICCSIVFCWLIEKILSITHNIIIFCFYSWKIIFCVAFSIRSILKWDNKRFIYFLKTWIY